jgi:hypothetical protein
MPPPLPYTTNSILRNTFTQDQDTSIQDLVLEVV